MASPLTFDIFAKDHGASKTFRDVGNEAEHAGKKGHEFGATMARVHAGPLKSIIGLRGPLVGAFAAIGSIEAFKGFIDSARESEKVGRLTAQVIKSTGGAAHVTSGQVEDLGAAISRKTGIDHDQIQSGENLLLTFTGIRNEVGKGNDIFTQATSTITDMSVALGQDTKSSAIQLGKALNDPIKGVTALQRVGVSFTASQKDQIKTLVKSGNTLGAQKLILHELGREFGGAAAAASTPMDKLKASLHLVGESLGKVLIPFLDKGAQALSDFISGFTVGTDSIGSSQSRFAQWGAVAYMAFERVRAVVQERVLPVLRAFGGYLTGTVAPALLKTGAFVARHAAAFKILGGALLGAFAAFKVGIAVVKAFTIAQMLLNIVLTANPIGIVVVAIGALIGGLIVAYKTSTTFRKVVDAMFWALRTGFGYVLPVVEKFGSVWLKVLSWIIRGYGLLLNAFLTAVGGIVHAAASAFGWVPGVGSKLRAADHAINAFKDGAVRALNAAANGASALSASLDRAARPRHATFTLDLQSHGVPAGTAAQIAKNVRFSAAGGYITGPGTGTSDSIPTMLSNGEYVINAASASRIGVPTLNRLNAMAGGGSVGHGGGMLGGNHLHIHVNVSGAVGTAREIARAITPEIVRETQRLTKRGFAPA